MLRSLRRRLLLFAVALVVVVVVVGDVAVSVTLQPELERQMDRTLAARVALVDELDGVPIAELAEVLIRREIPAVLVTDDGQTLLSRPEVVEAAGASQRVQRSDGSVEVFVSAGGADQALRGTRLALVAGSAVALAVGLLLLVAFADRVLRPLDDMVATARAIARGRSGARLGPADDRTEIGRLALAFDEMLDAQGSALRSARDAEGRSRRFLADAAHQLRTPVAGIRAASEALLHHPQPAEQDRLVAHLAREAARTGRLLDALLRVAQLDRGVSPDRQPTDLARLVTEEVERQQALAPSVAITVDATAGPLLRVDADGLREAVANLLDNARRHAWARIDVRLRVDDGTVTVRISDDGPGLAVGTEEEVFERFTSLDDRGGSGLGLPIARGIARAHGGDVRWRDGVFELTVCAGRDGLA